MLNKDYNLGSSWKLALILPLVFVAFIAVSCTDEDMSPMAADAIQSITEEDEQNAVIPIAPTQSGLTDQEVFYIVEDMPKFKGGEPAKEFRIYIAQNLNYPEIAIQDSISGRVIVQFAVNTEGKVVDAVVVRSVSPAIDKEAIRVVMSSPEWIPGKQRGKAVKVLFTFPINFALN